MPWDLAVSLSSGQRKAVDQLQRIARIEKSPLRVMDVFEQPGNQSWMRVHIKLDCRDLERREDGLPLNNFEAFALYIHADFPYVLPQVWTRHSRFRGFPHVQWRRFLCIYLSTETQWNPSRGMYGFLAQLQRWLEKAAINELDALDGPLHPPVAYSSADSTVYSDVDVPDEIEFPWNGAILLEDMGNGNLRSSSFAEIHELDVDQAFTPILLLDFKLTFEYPRTVKALFKQLEQRGVDTTAFIAQLMLASTRAANGSPLQVCIGAPARGIVGDEEQRLQHLQFWEIAPDDVTKLAAASLGIEVRRLYQEHENYEAVKALVDPVIAKVFTWSEQSKIAWCKTVENRPEIVIRRDAETPMDWFKDKSVTVWGCGALGSLVAEHLARAGVARIFLHDNKCVDPGILVRQNFTAADIGVYKTKALKRRIHQIDSNIEVVTDEANLYSETLDQQGWDQGVDLIIDATASLRVRSKLESVIALTPSAVPIGTMMISARARYGASVFAPANHTSGSLDLYRRLGQRARTKQLDPWVDALWNEESTEQARQPEPGCSDPTFVASHADVTRLASEMLNSIAGDAAAQDTGATGQLYAQNDEDAAGRRFQFTPDICLKHDDWVFRFSQNAWRDAQGWIRQGARLRSPQDETGGLLFGQIDDILGIAWISSVAGPPSDSEFSPDEFICGNRGVDALCEGHRQRSGDTLQYIGTWHSHPVSAARPSAKDFAGIGNLYAASSGEPFQLMMIIGHAASPIPEIGVYIFERDTYPGIEANEIAATCKGVVEKAPPVDRFPHQIGLALSGGGSRAVAFHLGTLRALQDLAMLDCVKVVSGVSGGSVMTGLLGYGEESFENVEASTVAFLRRGLVIPALRKLASPKRIIPLIASSLLVTLPAMVLGLLAKFLTKGMSWVPWLKHFTHLPARLHWPFRRIYSRTHVMADAIEDIVGAKMCNAPTQGSRDIVFNACELKTGTAFRMSNKEYGAWRFGYADASTLRVADAVAASAAFPLLLPAFDWELDLEKNGKTHTQRLVITDGGVYDNIGVTPMEPGRDRAYSKISYQPDFIIASDAGMGQFAGDDHPGSWGPRMVKVVHSVMRKVTDATKKQLHLYAKNGDLEGFLYVGLGQQDRVVPLKPGNWVPRDEVVDYPTDFDAMADEDLDALSNRAEAITRALATQYLLGE